MKKIKTKEIHEFNRLLGLLLFARMGFVASLEIIEQKTRNENFKQVLKEIIKAIKAGSSISQSFGKFPQIFSPLYLSAIKVAEETGQITEVLNEFVLYHEKITKLKTKIVAALRYPVFVLFIAILTLFFMVFVLIPSFQGVYASAGRTLPALTREVIALTEALQDNAAFLLLILVIAIFSGVKYFQNEAKKVFLYRLLLKTPLLSQIYLANILARFSLNMHILLKNKVGLAEALKIAKTTSNNQLFRNEIDILVKRLFRGESLTGNRTTSQFFDITFTKLLFVAEESAELDKAFFLISEFYSNQFDDLLDKVISMLEPMLILFIGIIVAIVLVAMYLPMFEMVNNFGF